jgi:hypothetical protein
MSKRKDRLKAEIGRFLRQYGRRAHAGHDPNDRSYSREIEALVKRMSPEEFDALVNDSDDDDTGPTCLTRRWSQRGWDALGWPRVSGFDCDFGPRGSALER